MIKAVIYARYSSQGQRDESIEGQLRDCRKYAKQNGMTVVREYCDKAISGTTDQRPEFQRMIADACDGLADVVICWKVDRFARNRMLAAIYREQLKKHNVKLCYAMENIPDEPMGIIVESLMEGYAEFYSANLSQNIKRGNLDSALKHQSVGVRVFGYSVNAQKQFEINEDEAQWVRYIFNEINKGASLKSIVDVLNRNQVTNKNGNPITTTMIHRIVNNPRYKGTYVYGSVTDDNGMPAIVGKDVWEVAQGKINSIPMSHRHIKKRAENFILSGRLFCGNCGALMIGDSAKNRHGNLFSYYSCTEKKHNHTCKKKSIRKEFLEELICKELWNFVSSPENCKRIVNTAYEIQMERVDNNTLSAIDKEIASLQRKRENVIRAIEDGVRGLADRMNALNDEIDRLMDERAKEEFNTSLVVSKEDISAYIETFQVLGYPDDIDMKEKLVRAFLKKAVVYDDRIDIYFDCNGLPITVDLKSSTNKTSAPPTESYPNTWIITITL